MDSERLPFQVTSLGSAYEGLSPPAVVLLDNVRSMYNVGSFFRTADAVGIEALYLAASLRTRPSRPSVRPRCAQKMPCRGNIMLTRANPSLRSAGAARRSQPLKPACTPLICMNGDRRFPSASSLAMRSTSSVPNC